MKKILYWLERHGFIKLPIIYIGREYYDNPYWLRPWESKVEYLNRTQQLTTK